MRLFLGHLLTLPPAPLPSSRSSTATITIAAALPFVLPSCAVLVCATRLVSASVRLPCLSIARTTRDAGHHSRFVHWGCFLPALHVRLWFGIGVCTWGRVTTTEGRLPGAYRGVVTSTRDGSDDGDHSACEHASARERGQPHHVRLRRSITELLGTSGTDERGGSPPQHRRWAMPQASHRSQTPDSCSARPDQDHSREPPGRRPRYYLVITWISSLAAPACRRCGRFGRCVTCTSRADSASVNSMSRFARRCSGPQRTIPATNCKARMAVGPQALRRVPCATMPSSCTVRCAGLPTLPNDCARTPSRGSSGVRHLRNRPRIEHWRGFARPVTTRCRATA